MKTQRMLLLIVLASACVSASDTAYVALGNATVSAEVADSPEERARGLMDRETLGENAGMLFAFPDEAPRSFWMKNTKIALDIIFISSNFIIVGVQTMEPCEEPCKLYVSLAPAQYALEVNRGFAEAQNIKVGDKIEIRFP